MSRQDRKNMAFFGLGTVGRDMFYAFIANALIYYLSNVLTLPQHIFVATSAVFTILRVVDALNDPLMGLLIDNGKSKFGKYKPPLVLGAVVGAICYMVIFMDFGIESYWFVVIFAGAYLLWDIFYGLNDIAYWSMLPSLSVDQKVREKTGAFARICANVGMFAVMVLWQPITSSLGVQLNNPPLAWTIFALAVTACMLGFTLFTVFGVKENTSLFKNNDEKTTLKGLLDALFKNDQLMWTTLSMSLFTIGYLTTTSFSIYYMQYVYGDAGMYAVLAAVVGVAQISALAIFPLISKRLVREKFYLLATILVIVGYGVFWLAGANIVIVVVAALFLFTGQAFIQLLMLMFLADTIEYGQWKLGKRSESITFSVQPLINKIGGAISMGFVTIGLIMSQIKVGEEAAESIPQEGQTVLKVFMIAVPVVFIVAGYVIYKFKFKISKEFYDEIVDDLKKKGQISE